MSRPPQIEPNRARMAEEAARCFQLRTQGLSLRDIAAATGLPRETVCRRIQHELDDRVAPAVAEYRALQDATLDALQAAAWNILDASHDPDVKLKAIDRLLRILERRARLHGWTPRQGGRRRHPARRPRPSWRPCSPPRTPVTRPCAPRLRAPDGGPLWVGHHRAGAGAPPLPGGQCTATAPSSPPPTSGDSHQGPGVRPTPVTTRRKRTAAPTAPHQQADARMPTRQHRPPPPPGMDVGGTPAPPDAPAGGHQP